jgi:hypothetical protein
MCNKISTSRSIKTIIIFLALSLVPMVSYSAEAKEIVESSSLFDVFSNFSNWLGKELKHIDKAYFNSDSEAIEGQIPVSVIVIEEELSAPLDLTIPEMNYEGSMSLDEGQPLNFPDMFSAPAKKPYVKEQPSASFSGGLLMDDEQLEGMEEYRLRNVKDAVRGAEVSLEFKIN